MVCHQKINSSVEIINQAALTLFCHAPGSLSGYVIFLDSLRCRDLTAAQLDTKDIDAWTKVGAQNRPATCPQGSWWVGHNQKKTWIARTLASGRRQASWFEDFLDPFLPRFWLGSFLRLLIFSKQIGKKKRKNKKIRATFCVYNSQVSCPEEAPGGASSARRGSWQSFCARKPPPGALLSKYSLSFVSS